MICIIPSLCPASVEIHLSDEEKLYVQHELCTGKPTKQITHVEIIAQVYFLRFLPTCWFSQISRAVGIEHKNTCHHEMNHGQSRQKIFHSDENPIVNIPFLRRLEIRRAQEQKTTEVIFNSFECNG